jgi:hypothetical protein
MTRDKLVYKDIIVFDDQWKIRGWDNLNTKNSYLYIECPCGITLYTSHGVTCRLCENHPVISEIVNITFNLIK